MKKEIEILVDKLLRDLVYTEEVCDLRKNAGSWECDIGNCDKCTALAIKLIGQRLKERENER